MLLLFLAIIALAGGSFLLALASDAFAYELSRVVEAAFDFVEYRAALRRKRRAEHGRREGRGALVGLRVG